MEARAAHAQAMTQHEEAVSAHEDHLASKLPYIVPMGAFGLSVQQRNQAMVALGEQVAYIAGKYIVIYSQSPDALPRMRVSRPESSVRAVISLHTSPDHSSLAVIQVLHNERQQVIFLDQMLNPSHAPLNLEGVKGSIWELAWSGDGQYVAGVARRQASQNKEKKSSYEPADSWQSVLYYWRKDGSLMCSQECTHLVRKVIVDPGNTAYIVSLGDGGQVTFWRRTNVTFTPLPVSNLHANNKGDYVQQGLQIVDICGLRSGVIVLATNRNSLMVVDRLKLVKEYDAQTAHVTVDRTIVRLQALTDKAFIAISTNNAVQIYNKASDSEPIAGKSLGVMLPECLVEKQNVLNVTTSESGKFVQLLVEDVGGLSLNLEIAELNDALKDPWSDAMPGFHTAGIVALTAARRRPILASASIDNTVRIWNYHKQVCVTAFQSSHPISAIAMHPWGTEMVVAYKENANTYVIANELIVGQRLESSHGGFTILKYAPSGAMLAAAKKYEILIYDTSTYKLCVTLKGHAEEVTDIQWSADSFRIVTVCKAAVFVWSMETYEKILEDTTRTHVNQCALPDQKCESVIVGDWHSGVRVFATERTTEATVQSVTHGGLLLSELKPELLTFKSEFKSEKQQAQETAQGGEVANLRLMTRAHAGLQRNANSMLLAPQCDSVVSMVNSVSSEDVGFVRVSPFPPFNDVAVEKQVHNADLTAMCCDHSAMLLFTCDREGIIVVSVLLPRLEASQLDLEELGLESDARESSDSIYARAQQLFPSLDPAGENRALNCVYLPESVIERMKLEIQNLREGARMHKTEMEWERLKLIRHYQGDIGRMQAAHKTFETEMHQSMEDLVVRTREEVAEVLSNAQQQRQQMEKQMEEQQDWIEKRLAREIQRTDLAEKEMTTMKHKFAMHLAHLKNENADASKRHEEEEETLHQAFQGLKEDARTLLEQRRVQSDLELLLEARLNEEDLENANKKMKSVLAEQQGQFMKLFADFQIQKTHLARALGDVRRIEMQNEQLRKDKDQLQAGIKLLEDQKVMFQRAEGERNQRDLVSNRIYQENEERLRRLTTYQTLAENRMESQQEKLGPLMVSLKQSVAELAEAEELQNRNLQRFDKLYWERGHQGQALSALKRENYKLSKDAADAKKYVGNLLSNLWRTIHEEPKEMWPAIFGKLYADHFSGREPRRWSVYSAGAAGAPDSSGMQVTPDSRRELTVKALMQAKHDPSLQAELVLELQNNLLSAERMIESLQVSKRLAQKSRDTNKATMVNENRDLLKLINDLRRDNKDRRDRVSALEAEVAMYKATSRGRSLPAPCAKAAPATPSLQAIYSGDMALPGDPRPPSGLPSQPVAVGFSYTSGGSATGSIDGGAVAGPPRPPPRPPTPDATAVAAGAAGDGSTDWSRRMVRDPATPSGLRAQTPAGRSEMVIARDAATGPMAAARPTTASAPLNSTLWGAQTGGTGFTAIPEHVPAPSAGSEYGVPESRAYAIKHVGNAFGSPAAVGMLHMLDAASSPTRAQSAPSSDQAQSGESARQARHAHSLAPGNTFGRSHMSARAGSTVTSSSEWPVRPQTLAGGFATRSASLGASPPRHTTRHKLQRGSHLMSKGTGASLNKDDIRSQVMRDLHVGRETTFFASARSGATVGRNAEPPTKHAASISRQARPQPGKVGLLKSMQPSHPIELPVQAD